MRFLHMLAVCLCAAAMTGCDRPAPEPREDEPARSAAPEEEAALIDFEEFTLDNGLRVVFHIDRSDPVAAVVLTAHVGSAREKPGRTGFAHLFEHLLFLESENLGKGGLDAMSARIGGSGANGSTSRDITNYLQTVPNDALEKMLWAEADKLGWFINTVTDPVLAKEKQVVKNEKRQSVDNRPYGHLFYVLGKALYPQDHPYNWQVIGSLEDLDAATLEDVKQFYRAWYTPNNVTLSVAGDFDPEQAREWVEKYFGEIPRGPDVEPLDPQRPPLEKTALLYHEDNYAQLPMLAMAWPTVPQFHEDYYALNALHDLLTVGKTAPLNEVLIDEKKLTSGVSMFGYNSELAGDTILNVRAFNGVDLDDVKTAIEEGLARFENDGIAEKDLARVKTTQEVAYYGAVQSVLGKAAALGEYDQTADAGLINRQTAIIRALDAEDVMRVYETYIKDKPFVAASFTPKGAADLALEGSARADVVEEPIVQGAEEAFDASASADYVRTPSSFDRTVEPPYGEPPVVRTPPVWRASLDNGLEVYGVEDSELPLARFELSIDGGRMFDNPEKPGAANLLAEILDKGTADRTVADLEEALAALGASVSVSAGDERFVIAGQTLARNFTDTIALVQEILLEPRWDEEEFSLAKARVENAIAANAAEPNAIADNAYALVTYGADHLFARPLIGTAESVEAMSLDELKAFHAENLAPNLANFRVVGDVDEATVLSALTGLEDDWAAKDIAPPTLPPAEAPAQSAVYFYDVPGASQSVFRFGYPALKRTDEGYYKAVAMNYRLGGGGFASRLTQELREGKGYTYGVASGFAGTARRGGFLVYSGVRANVTFEAADLIKTILSEYGATYTEEDLRVTKSSLLKSQARAFETLGAKLGLLQNIADYGLPDDYVERQTAEVEALTVDDMKALADDYIAPGAMHYVIVGDAATQAGRLEALGYGAPVSINDEVDSVY